MSFNLGWPASSPAHGSVGQRSAGSRSQEHLRIKDLVHSIEAADLPHRRDRQVFAPVQQLRNSYEVSLRNIDDNIYALAAATAALDRVEGKLVQARSQIELLCSRGEEVDLGKVERTLIALAEHVNQSVQRADENYVNLLRDSRLQMQISEVGGKEHRSMQVDLTMISLEKLIAWKLRDGPTDPEAWIDLIDTMSHVTLQNVQILSSLILTLFAARDYTTDVVQLVMSPNSDQPRPATATRLATDFVQSARAALMRDEPVALTNRAEPRHDVVSKPPNRLMTFLNQVTFQA